MSVQIFLLLVLLTGTKLCLSDENQKFTIISTTSSPAFDDHQQNKIEELENKLAAIELKLSKLQYTSRDTNDILKPSDQNLPRNCKEVQNIGYNNSTVYYIQPKLAPEPFLVLCNMKTRGGGWTTILNRFDGSQDFDLGWNKYKKGFGGLRSEFWLGLDNIHYLTGHQINELLVELVDWDSKTVFAHYSHFVVGSEKDGYGVKLLEGYSGTAGNSMTREVDMKFSTTDRDQDFWSNGNCADFFKGGWWYHSCLNAHLTGLYLKKDVAYEDVSKGMFWESFRGQYYSLKEVRMMVRPLY